LQEKQRGVIEMGSAQDDVKALDRQWVEAVNSGDAAGVAAFYADDAIVLAPNNEPLQGRNQIQGFFEDLMKLQPSFDPLDSLRIVEAGDLVVGAGRYSLKLLPPGADAPITDHGKYLGVFKRQADGSLKLILDTWNTSLPLA
jgi:ketosteroid isomerase-like protein